MTINLDEMIPEQIERALESLEKALAILKVRKNTMSKEVKYERQEIVCVKCGSHHIRKDGRDKKTKVQMYECGECGKKFNDLTDTVFHYTHLNYEQIVSMIECMNNRFSLIKTAAIVGINKNTSFLWRHKISDSLSNIRNEIKLTGEIEADEVYKGINLKGTPAKKMPRYSKPRQSNGTTKRGINSHKVCIISAIDENDNAFLEIAGTGPVTQTMIKEKLVPKIDNVSSLITDCKSSYEDIAKKKNWHLVQIKSQTHVDDDGNSLADINSYHSGLTTFLSPFRGVSTKHLQHYLDWYMYSKILNFTIEKIQHSKKFFKTILTKNTSISTKNVHKNHSGINFLSVYADYAI